MVERVLPVPYLLVLPVVLGGLRFGVAGAAVLTLLTHFALTDMAQVEGSWPSGGNVADRLAVAWAFVGVVAFTGLVVAASATARRRVADGLRQSEVRWRALFERAPVALGLLREGRFVLLNPMAQHLLGEDRARLSEMRLADCIEPADQPALAAWLERVPEASSPPAPCKVHLRRHSGATAVLEIRSAEIPLEKGVTGTLVCLADLTQAERDAAEMARINRILRTVSECNHAIVAATGEQALLAEICQIFASKEGYRLVWVGSVEHDDARTIRPVASAGLDNGYLSRLAFSWAEGPTGQGPAGRAVRTGRAVACRDLEQDAAFAPWRPDALDRGFRAVVALPLRQENRVFAVLCLYSGQVQAFGEEEVALLQEMADSLAFGMTGLRVRERQAETDREMRRLLEEAERGRAALLQILDEQRAAERARIKSEERYRDAVKNSAIGMAILNPAGRWLEVNPAFCRMLGYSREELLALKSDDLAHPGDSASAHQRRRDLAEGRSAPYVVEKRYFHKSGRIVWVQLSVSVVEDEAGVPSGNLFCQAQDITARKLAEESLAAVAERLALALRASKLGVWRYNVQTGVSEWDARMFAIFGYPPGATVPPLEDILQRVAEEDREAVRTSWQPSPACDRTYRMRLKVNWRNGEQRHVDLQGIVHDDSLGRPEWTIGVAGDITEIVRATSESERLRAQLMQAGKMEALGTLAAGVAHDFNNLLTGINGFVELASNRLSPNHEAAQLLQHAHQGAVSARDLVRRILNFSRGSEERVRTVLDLAAIVKETLPLVRAGLRSSVKVTFEAEEGSYPVLSDTSELQQIIMNLCTNAGHAIGPGGGTVSLQVDVCTVGPGAGEQDLLRCAAGRYVRLTVKDTGCGMDEATRRRLFQPFFTTKQKGVGTGLGLSIIRDIVAGHEGGVAVETATGVGTTFRILLPWAGRIIEPQAPVRTPTGARGAGQRLLVVDDEPSVAMIIRLALQKNGFAPEVYTSPQEAWVRFSAEPSRFDLLVIDQNMPEITGPDFVLRARQLSPDLPVVMISGRFEQAVATGPVDAQGLATLRKPFEISDLIDVVRNALGSRVSRTPVRPPTGSELHQPLANRDAGQVDDVVDA